MLVAKGYRRIERDQLFLMPQSMREWLPATDPVWLVISVVERLDTSRLHAQRKTGGAGRAGYDPDMMLTLLIWAWAQGQRSSRTIERLCVRDVAFRIVCAGDAPDHVTISRFRADCAEVVEDLFTQVLVVCAELGMGQLGVVALDGTKIASDASMSANRTEDGLRKAAAAEQARAEHARAAARAAAAEHAATDADEDDLFGPESRGDEMPDDLAEPSARAARIDRALADLEQENARRAADRAAVDDRKAERGAAKRERRQAQRDAYQRRRAESDGIPKGKPLTEFRVEVLTANLAEARARQQSKIDRYRAGNGKGWAPAPVEDAYLVKRVRGALDRALAAAAAAEHQARVAVAEAAATAATPVRTPKRNLTDPDSRTLPLRGGGWLQGYNCQAVTSSDGLIIATGVGNNPNDATAFTTMLGKAVTAAELIASAQPAGMPRDRCSTALLTSYRAATTPAPEPGHPDPATAQQDSIGMLLADAGYLSEANLNATGPDRLIAVGKNRAMVAAAHEQPATGPAPADSTVTEQMTHLLRTPEGAALYRRRAPIAETPFGHAKHNLGFRRFTSRGIHRATAEFAFHALVHNLFKAISSGHLAPKPA